MSISDGNREKAKALKIFADKELWRQTLSNVKLDQLAADLKIPGYHGAVSRDRMRFPVYDRESWILNLQGYNQGNKQGTHWVALIRDSDKVWYFDSYGAPPVDEVRSRYPHLQVVSNTFMLQDFSDVYCGMISLYVLYAYWHLDNRDFYKTALAVRKAYG